MQVNTAVEADLAQLRDLNNDYIHSVQHSDVARFEQILANDFMCSLSDGSLIDRREFLDYSADPAHFTNLAVHDVIIRTLGDYAIIHARTTFMSFDGQAGASRYTDVWERRNGNWLAVSAQITRY